MQHPPAHQIAMNVSNITIAESLRRYAAILALEDDVLRTRFQLANGICDCNAAGTRAKQGDIILRVAHGQNFVAIQL
jgi:hypothetical protein